MSDVVFQNFAYAYNGVDKVLDNICLTIPAGSFTVVAGPNGAGKTTLCHAIAGVVPHFFGGAYAGTLTIAGMNTATTEISQLAQHVGTVFEDYESQLVNMTVEEEIAFGLENRGEPLPYIQQTVMQVLQTVGLSGLEEREVASLSGGQKQRLAIASVLAIRPGILVFDEAASAMDPEGKEELYALLYRLNQEKHITVIVVEHDLSLVLPYASQLVLLSSGMIHSVGEPMEILNAVKCTEEFMEFLPSILEMRSRLQEILGVSLGAWRDAESALSEVLELLATARTGVSKSA